MTVMIIMIIALTFFSSLAIGKNKKNAPLMNNIFILLICFIMLIW
jgi:hypothetical protein